MGPLYIEKSKLTPQVILDKSKGIFLIQGRSVPENAASFYEPIFEWLTDYINDPDQITIFAFDLEYFNSASSKVILHIIKMLETILNNGFDVRINWCYQEYDEDTLEAGQTYESLTDIPFVFNGLQVNN